MLFRSEWIVPNAQKNQMEPILLTLKAGGFTSEVGPFEGEAMGYVIKGSATLHYGGDSLDLAAGETFYMKCSRPHSISSSSGAEILWVSTPPGF